VGFARHKKRTGRKRQVLVDPLGLILPVGVQRTGRAVVVTAAGLDDRLGLRALWQGYFAPGVQRLRTLWVEGGYRAEWRHEWVGGLKQTHKIDWEVVAKEGKGFQVLPRRWVGEQTLAWLRGREDDRLLLLLEEQQTKLHSAMLAPLRLTRRETEVLFWVMQGKTNQEIALILALSPLTVRLHLEHIYRKLGVETRTAAVMQALETLGLLGR
jgi:DNA-binding CsgD family transcriptional regulator